jgi:hypothetical protein
VQVVSYAQEWCDEGCSGILLLLYVCVVYQCMVGRFCAFGCRAQWLRCAAGHQPLACIHMLCFLCLCLMCVSDHPRHLPLQYGIVHMRPGLLLSCCFSALQQPCMLLGLGGSRF